MNYLYAFQGSMGHKKNFLYTSSPTEAIGRMSMTKDVHGEEEEHFLSELTGNCVVTVLV